MDFTLLKEYERIVTLKGEIFRVNLNFLDLDDLDSIQQLSYDLGIEDYLTDYNLESLYNSNYDKIEEIYETWCQEIVRATEEIEKKIMNNG